MLLPFLLGALHRAGFLQWIKTEWVTYNFWQAAFIKWWTHWTDDAAAVSPKKTDEEEDTNAKANADATKEQGRKEQDCCDTGQCAVRVLRTPFYIYTSATLLQLCVPSTHYREN